MDRRFLAMLTLPALGLLAASAAQRPPTAHAAEPAKVITNSIGMKLALIPAGKFMMGSPDTEKERDAEEHRHEVAITRPFYLGVYEVTQAEYEKVTRYNPSYFNYTRGGGSGHPVENFRFKDAEGFLKKLSELPEEKQAGRVYRLPTEAEWEYACRAGTTTVFHCGNSLSSKQANVDGNYPYGTGEKGPHLAKTVRVGSYEPNAFGLYDMHGNVSELCSDWYDPDYYRNSPRDDPPGPGKGVVPTGYGGFFLVGRGGCWLDEARGCRAAARFRFMPSDGYRLLGLRLACAVPDAKP